MEEPKTKFWTKLILIEANSPTFSWVLILSIFTQIVSNKSYMSLAPWESFNLRECNIWTQNSLWKGVTFAFQFNALNDK